MTIELPEHGTGVRAARRAAAQAAAAEPATATGGPTRSWMLGFFAAITAAAVAAIGLTYVGVDTLRDSNAGRRVRSADPSEPGFEGLLAPTPTLLVVHQSDGVLRSAALLALANGDEGGSVVLLPPSVEVGDGDDAATLAVTYAFGGTPEVLRGAGEAISGVGVQEVVLVDDSRWAELVAPVAPIAVDNPDATGEFRAGPVDLAPEDVGSWLGSARREEGELAALFRQQLFWEAWIDSVAAAGRVESVPGELDSGMGRFVRALAAGPSTVTTVPVVELTDQSGNQVFEVDRVALSAVVTDLVPFPTGTALAPRTRVRLLDGTGEEGHVRDVAPTVVAADATIVVVGNADAFDYRRTEIRYHHTGQRAAAERFLAVLGTGVVIEDVRPIDSFDVTIVLGPDT